jgi:hypothetical protein
MKLLLLLLALSGCATPEPPKAGTLNVLDAECDALGVKSVRILATGAAVATISWDNVSVCGEPV